MARDSISGQPEPAALREYNRVEREIYSVYLEHVVPLIAAIEVFDNEFPSEILNEVRSIFTHFARCRTTEDMATIEDNARKAERHLKRLRFDCYKYIASMHSQHIGALLGSYSPKALAGVDNGNFLLEVNRLTKLADDKIISAKVMEASGDEDGALEAYAESTEIYADLIAYVGNSKAGLAHAQALYGAFEDGVKRSGTVGIAVGVIGAIIGVVGIVVGIVF